jgi:AcrR family transcriptional regulator
MPKASMLAPSQRDWDRNAYHVRKGVVLMFRIHLQITSRALSSGGDAACLPARPHRKKKRQRAAALVEAARSLALETGVASVTLTAVANRAGAHYSAVRRYFTSHKEVLLHLAAEGWFRWSNTVCAALREPGPNVAIAGRRDVSQRFGRRLALLRPARQLHLHLEYEVDLERVVEVKRISATAVISLADAIEQAFPPLGRPRALDNLLACRLLWRPPCGRSPTRRRG